MSYTTDDMVYKWDPNKALNIKNSIQMPELILKSASTSDCTTSYSTGTIALIIF